jgi:Tfp pilus assembly protein FimT
MVNFKHHFLPNITGFTLIELMVVIGIFMMVFGFTYGGLRNNRRLGEFRLTADQVASDIRKVQTMALAGISAEDLGNVSYGIYFNINQPNSYLIFKDDGNKVYEAGIDETIQTVTFPQDISLSAVEPALPTNDLAIVFSPPQPTTYINGGIIENTATITLIRSNLPTKQGIITINRVTGRITAELIDI